MVSSVCADPDSHCSLAHGAAIVFLPFQSSRQRSRFGIFPAPHATLYDSGRLAGLCGHPFSYQLVPLPAVHASTRRGHAVVSWPPLCIVTRDITTSAPVCLALFIAMHNRP